MPVPYWRLSAFYFAYFAYVGTAAPYFSLYLASLGLAAAQIGVLLSLGALGRFLLAHIVGMRTITDLSDCSENLA